MATDQFSLCWNNFHSNLSSGFHSLYQSEDFVDVTLAADGRYLKAHKMVLSVCSQYFKELFHANPCKHPIVILKDVSYSALRDLLQFMYLGEVSVSQEELSNLMKVAELLQIKGLTEENVDTSHMNQNGLKNIHVTDVKSLSDPRSYLKRAKTFKKSRTEVPAKICKSNSSSECRDSQSPSTFEVDSNPSLLVESELIEPVKPKEEPADYSTESGNQSEHSIPDMDVSSMLDTNLGETSSSSCWKSDTKTFGPSGSSTAELESDVRTCALHGDTINYKTVSLSDMSDHFSSSDEDLEEILEIVTVPKPTIYFEETVPPFSGEQFSTHFRLSREMAEELANRFAASDYYHRQEGASEKVSPFKFVTVFLWYAANGAASFIDVSDRFNISKSTLHKIIRRMTYFLSNLSPEFIKWPSDAEKLEIENYFRTKHLPGVIGIIDGTHIKIDKPADDPDSYLNRKHFYSIQAQMVCDHTRRIRDIFVGFPGSVHDGRILRSSTLYETLAEKCNDRFILGDSGYPCLRHLLTPFRDNGHLTRRQRNYNHVLSKNRYIIEHCFGILKQKFQQLQHIKLKNVADIVHFIRACAVLHNLSIDEAIIEDGIDPLENDREVVLTRHDRPERDDRDGIAVRNELMNTLPLLIE